MKLIEALKKIKELQRKADDIAEKIGKYCVDYDCETPVYPDQRKQIEQWLQAHGDIVKEILHLRVSIQRTNLVTNVTMELGNTFVTKTIAEWIHRRKDLASLQEKAWHKLTDKGLQPESKVKLTPTTPEQIVRIRRYFDPQERDTKIELYRNEPAIIDRTLEVVNAVTDLIER